MEGKRGQDVFIGFIVGVTGNAVVVGGSVELREEQGLSLAVIKGAGEKNAQTVKLMAISGSAFIGAKASRLKRKFPILHLF